MKRRWFIPKLHIELERWKYYLPLDIYVSNLGNIRNTAGDHQKVCVSNGYTYYKGRRVHRIVMEAWNPVPGFAELTVDHLNHNTRDNRVSNLEWVSAEENSRRDQEDKAENAPVDNGVTYVLLNGIKIPFETAKQIVNNDKSLSKCKANVDKAFDKVKNSKGGTIGFGNFTLQKCG